MYIIKLCLKPVENFFAMFYQILRVFKEVEGLFNPLHKVFDLKVVFFETHSNYLDDKLRFIQ